MLSEIESGEASPGFLAAAMGKLGDVAHLPPVGPRGWRIIAGLIVIGWLASGIYKVQPDEQGMVIRFGKFVDATPPGLHYHLPYPFETVALPRVTQVNQLQIGLAPSPQNIGPKRSNQMLTGDENILEANYVVFWKIKDPVKYQFKLYDPEDMVRMVAESTMREVVARFPIQGVLSDQRQKVASEAQDALQHLLDDYDSGIQITAVQLQRVDPPAAVIDAFNDVQRARADQERARNDAESYRNDILPRARGEAQHIVQEAEAYKAQVVDYATGEAASYRAIYKVYQGAKDVVGWRLYFDSIDEVLRHAKSVLVDASGKGVNAVQPYMPFDPAKLAAPAGGPAK